jgi:hypothetical protein
LASRLTPSSKPTSQNRGRSNDAQGEHFRVKVLPIDAAAEIGLASCAV